jgi:radical SAM-linked protein
MKAGYVMNLIRYKFIRSEKLKYISHLDQQRLFIRAFKRSMLPVVYSQGFNPHMKLTFALALPVGMTSDCEYGDIYLSEKISPAKFVSIMNTVLPDGIKVISAEYFDVNQKSLTSKVYKCDYEVEIKLYDVLKQDDLQKKFDNFMTREEILYTKINKRNRKVTKNIREAIDNIIVKSVEYNNAFIFLRLYSSSENSVKVSIVLDKFNDFSPDIFDMTSNITIHKKNIIFK